MEDAGYIFDSPDKMYEHIERLKSERKKLASEVACLHRVLLFIVRNKDINSGGAL